MSKFHLGHILNSQRKRSSSASRAEPSVPKIKIPWTEMPPPNQPLTAKTNKSKLSQSLDSVEEWFSNSQEKVDFYQNQPSQEDRSHDHSMDDISSGSVLHTRQKNSVSESNLVNGKRFHDYDDENENLAFSFDISKSVQQDDILRSYTRSTSKEGSVDLVDRPCTPSFLTQRRTAKTFQHISVTSPNLQSLLQSSRESVSSAVSSRTREKVKKRFWWFSRMGDASKAFEEVGHDIHDTLPVLMQHADEAICAVKEVSIALCGLATGEHLDNEMDTPGPSVDDDKVKSVPEALFSISEAAHSFASVMNEQKVDEILNTIREISRSSQHTMRIIQQSCNFIVADGRVLFSLVESLIFLVGSGVFVLLMLIAQGYLKDLSLSDARAPTQSTFSTIAQTTTQVVTLTCLILACIMLTLSSFTFAFLYMKNVRNMIR